MIKHEYTTSQPVNVHCTTNSALILYTLSNYLCMKLRNSRCGKSKYYVQPGIWRSERQSCCDFLGQKLLGNLREIKQEHVGVFPLI